MELVKEIYMGSATPGSGGSAVIDPLNVTPSTSAQTITASGGTDGYSPVNVAAVDASIDANITAGNIKSGVTILGVTGNVVELDGETVSVTPTTSSQTITPTSPKNAITEVSVSAVTSSIDANITAGNIKKDVTILGVTGTLESGITPTGTMYIISNGTYNVADKAIANVNVPTTAPALYREFQLDANGTLVPNTTTTHIMNFTGMTDVLEYVLAYAYYNNTAISGAVDMSDLTTLSGNSACARMFYGCTGITGANLSGLTTITGPSACTHMFYNCTNLINVNLSSLTTLGGTLSTQYNMYYMFSGCSSLQSIDMSALTTITGGNALTYAFSLCTSLTTVYIGGTTAIDFGARKNQFNNMFSGCTQNIDVYAPAANQAQIEGFTGYPNFGSAGPVTWHWRS